MALDQTELSQIISAVLAALKTTDAAPKASSRFLPKGSHAAPTDLAAKDQHLINAFHRKGFKDVVLMDRDDPSKDYNIRPFKGWLEQGRIVRKGSKGIRGLFHRDQTDPLPGKAPAKPTITTEQKELFAKAKAAFQSKKAKAKPQPVA